MIKLNIQLFASGSFELAKATGNASWKSLQGKIEWSSVSQGSEKNESILTTKLYGRTWTGGTSGRGWSGSVKAGNNTAHTFSQMDSSWANKDVASTYVLFQTYTDTIKHNDDGTCKITIDAVLNGCKGTSLEGISSKGSKEITLDTIPRASTLDSFGGSKRIGVANDVIINFTKRKSTFTTTLAYATKDDLSDLTEIVTKTTNSNTYSWTIPINLLNKIPNSKTLDIYVLLATFDGDTQIGASQVSKFTAIVYEENCKPTWVTHTIEETDTTAKQLVTTANKFIANLSKPKFTFSATGQYGATISYYQINNVTRSSGFTDSSFNINGYTLKVVDSRGVANTYTFNLSYVPYFTPVFEEVKLFRDVPTSNKVFSYFKIKFFNNTSSVKFDNPQALSYKFNYQESGGTSQEVSITPTTIDDGTSRYAENETELGNTFNYKKSVGWTFSFVDLSGKTFTTNNTLPMGIPLMNGKMNSDGEQELYINGKLTVDSNVVSKNLFNKNSANIIKGYSTSSEIISGSTGRLTYIPCEPNTTYTIQKIASTRFILSCSEIKPAIGTQVTRLAIANSQTVATVTTNNTAKYLIVDYFDSDTDEQSILDSIQIEEGSTASDYVPYLNLEEAMQEDIWENKRTLVINSDIVYDQDLSYRIFKLGKVVFVNIYSMGFKKAVNNGDLLFSGLPKPNDYVIFIMYGSTSSQGKTVRVALNLEGQAFCHWGGTDSYGDSANKQFGCMIMYETTD